MAWQVMFGPNQPKIQQLFLSKQLLASELTDVTSWGQLINVYFWNLRNGCTPSAKLASLLGIELQIYYWYRSFSKAQSQSGDNLFD